MTVRAALRSYLVDTLDVDGRVYANKSGEGSEFPYVRYRRIDAVRTYFHESFAETVPWVAERFQFDCTDLTPEGAEELGDALIAALSGFRGDLDDVSIGDVRIVTDIDRPDAEFKIFRRVIDAIVSHAELEPASS